MTDIPTMIITPSTTAARAYARTDAGAGLTAENGFGATLQRAMESAVNTGHQADSQTMRALAGGGNLTDVVTALSRAELTLQTATAIRDRVVQAYQDIVKMPI
jgi:flagellar hook-basal body complex protein FliE